MPFGNNFFVEVRDDRNVQSRRAASNPIFAELIAMASVNGLNGVAKLIENPRKGLKGPSIATLGFPACTVIFEGTKRNESVMR